MERVNAYLLGNEIFSLMLLVVSIYRLDYWDNAVDVKHMVIVTQTPFTEIPVVPYPLVSYLVYFIFFSGICRCKTDSSSSTSHIVPVR